MGSRVNVSAPRESGGAAAAVRTIAAALEKAVFLSFWETDFCWKASHETEWVLNRMYRQTMIIVSLSQ